MVFTIAARYVCYMCKSIFSSSVSGAKTAFPRTFLAALLTISACKVCAHNTQTCNGSRHLAAEVLFRGGIQFFFRSRGTKVGFTSAAKTDCFAVREKVLL